MGISPGKQTNRKRENVGLQLTTTDLRRALAPVNGRHANRAAKRREMREAGARERDWMTSYRTDGPVAIAPATVSRASIRHGRPAEVLAFIDRTLTQTTPTRTSVVYPTAHGRPAEVLAYIDSIIVRERGPARETAVGADFTVDKMWRQLDSSWARYNRLVQQNPRSYRDHQIAASAVNADAEILVGAAVELSDIHRHLRIDA